MARLMASVDKQIDDEAGPSGQGLSDDKGTFQAAAQTPSQYVANQKLAQEAQQKSDKQRVEKEATSAMRDPAGAIAGEAGLEDAAGDQLTKTQQEYRSAVETFRGLASEAETSAHHATAAARTELAALIKKLKAEKAQLLEWLHTQHSNAAEKIHAQRELLATIRRQMRYLQSAHGRAVQKAKQYLEQLQHLDVQHRLQTTPPFSDAVTKVALTEEQYGSALAELTRWRDTAMGVSRQALQGYQRREVAAQELEDWVQEATHALHEWTDTQKTFISRRLLAGRERVEDLQARLKGLERVSIDAAQYTKRYAADLERLKLAGQVAALESILGSAAKQRAVIAARARTLGAAQHQVSQRLEDLLTRLSKLGGPIVRLPAAPPDWMAYIDAGEKARDEASASAPQGSAIFPQTPAIPAFELDDLPNVPFPAHASPATFVASPYSFKAQRKKDSSMAKRE